MLQMTDRWVINLNQFSHFWVGKWDPHIDRECQKRGLGVKNVEKQRDTHGRR